jgi:UPF0755 protein
LVIAFVVIAVVAVIGVAAGGVVLYGRSQLDAPASAHGTPVTVQVASGESVDQVAADLQNHGLIRSSFWFGWFAKFKGLGGSLHSGAFKLDSGMGASAIISRLSTAPDVQTVKITFTEGTTATQMAKKVADSGVGVTADQYLAEVRTGSFTASFLSGRPAGASLEGFLYPDTYQVPQGSTAHDIVQMQLDNFSHRIGTLLASPPHGLTGYQMVVLASIIESEARFDDDRAKVASAIYNRLGQKMALQSDATVAYGLGISGREPTAAEFKIDTPYNSYLHAGLTPTPVSNPGLPSLQAAAQPAQTPYLFWVADGCGHNHYAVTLSEHDQQVSRYLNSPCPSPTP